MLVCLRSQQATESTASIGPNAPLPRYRRDATVPQYESKRCPSVPATAKTHAPLMRRFRFVYVCGFAIALLASGLGAWKLTTDRDFRHLEAREFDLNPTKATPIAGLHSSRLQPLRFTMVTVDNTTLQNGRKPKVIIDPDGRGGVVGAQAGAQGFALYRPGQPPQVISSYHGGIGAEDAQAADVTGNHFPDIIVGGLNGVTFVLFNPRDNGCADVYRCGWKRSVIDRKHPSHDIVVGDVDRNGRIDIATESGIYFNQGRGDRWRFVGRRLIARDGELAQVFSEAGRQMMVFWTLSRPTGPGRSSPALSIRCIVEATRRATPGRCRQSMLTRYLRAI